MSEVQKVKKAILSLTYWLAQVGTLGAQDVRAMDKLLNSKRSKSKKVKKNG